MRRGGGKGGPETVKGTRRDEEERREREEEGDGMVDKGGEKKESERGKEILGLEKQEKKVNGAGIC